MLKSIKLPRPSDRDFAVANGYKVTMFVKRPKGLRLASASQKIIFRVRDRDGDVLSHHSNEAEAWAIAADAARIENDLYFAEKRKNILRPINPSNPISRSNEDVAPLEISDTLIHPQVLRSNRLQALKFKLALQKKFLPEGCEANLKMIREILREVKPQSASERSSSRFMHMSHPIISNFEQAIPSDTVFLGGMKSLALWLRAGLPDQCAPFKNQTFQKTDPLINIAAQ